MRRRVNEDDGNAWTAWRAMGRPASPTTRQLDDLHVAATPAVEHRAARDDPDPVEHSLQGQSVDLPLSRHEVTLVEVHPVRDEAPPWLDDTRIPGYGRQT